MRRSPIAVLAAVAAATGLAAVGLAAGDGPVAPTPAEAGCITRLPVSYAFPSRYGAAYSKRISVKVTTRGPRVKKLRVQLYTFTGRLMAQGSVRKSVTSSKTVRMSLKRGFRPMQPGKYTLVLTGEPNRSRSCGPKQRISVVRFKDCTTKLPVTFPGAPKGKAADYGGALSVRVGSQNGQLLKGVSATLSSFSGQQLGTVKLGTIFGEKTATFQVPGGVKPGGYTVSASGVIADQPSSCGPKSASTTLEFQ